MGAPRLFYGWVSKGRQSFSSSPSSNSERDYRNITSNTTSAPIYGWVYKGREFVTSLTPPSGYDYRNASSATKSTTTYGWVTRTRQVPMYSTRTTGYTAARSWQELVGYTASKDLYD